MTVQELLQKENYLTKADEEHIYLVPSGKRGYTSFPVGETKVIKPAVEPSEENPEGTPEEYGFVPKEGAIKVTPDEYQGIINQTHIFSEGKVILYVPTEQELELKEKNKLISDYEFSIAASEEYLKEKDYIGIKIATAMTQEETEYLKTYYHPEISLCRDHRANVDSKRTEISRLKEEVDVLKAEVE